jgi:shikimate kinase
MLLFLIGYRGTGKSTVGKRLAERMEKRHLFVDADPYLEAREGRTIKEMFAAEGEAYFRDREAEVVAALAQLDDHVLALGGGAILRDSTRQILRQRGKSIWLQAKPETIYARIQADPTTADRRPNLTVSGGYNEIKELLARREPIYQECADFTVDTEGKDVEQIVSEILSLMGN